jgi:hypothetical protein
MDFHGFSKLKIQELEAVALAMQPGEVSEVLGTEARVQLGRSGLSTGESIGILYNTLYIYIIYIYLEFVND